MAVGDIGGIGPGQVPVDVRALLAQVALTNAKALAATLTPGEILNARVGADLGNGNVALTVRGQTLVANTATTLLQDSLIKLVVQSTDNEQPLLRLLASPLPDQANTSTVAARAVALGLPATALASTVLQAFEQAGAPLDSTRLKEAITQLQTLPPAQVAQRAQVLATLAQAGLPATPPFIALAERSAAGTLPNPAAAVAELQRVAQSTSAGVTTGGQQPVAGGQVLVVGSQQLATGAQRPAPSAQQPTANSQQPALGNRPPPANIPNPLLTDEPSSTPVSTLPITTDDAPITEPRTSPTVVAVPRPVPTAPVASPAVPIAVPLAPASPTAPLVSSTIPVPTPTGLPTPASPSVATVNAATLMPQPTATLAGTPIPDLARGGATAVLQALALAGVRPRETGETLATKAEPTLLHRLDVPVEETDPVRSSLDSTMRHPQQPALEAAVAHVMREQAAETVVKPQALVDYDIVLGLPIQVNGQPMPARLAVAERQTSAGTATFLRVDAELTHLGPLSVRISGIENGPMAITVLATGPALGALADALPDLNDSLRALGLTAGVRIADLIEDLGHG